MSRVKQFLSCFQHSPTRLSKTDVTRSTASNILSTKSTTELFVATSIFTFCRFEILINPAIKLLRKAAESGARMSSLLLLTKYTAFKHFCAGETLEDCQRIIKQMKRSNVGVLLDQSVEEREEPSEWKINVGNKIQLLEKCSENNIKVLGVPIKATAMVSPHLLETMTKIIVNESKEDQSYIDLERCPLSQLSTTDISLYNQGMKNLQQVCAKAEKFNIPILLDAEQSHRQPAIDFICRRLQLEFNKKNPIVWNTYQMYMKCSGRRLQRDLKDSVNQNYKLAAKIVRGAYVMAEMERSNMNDDWKYPLWDEKKLTDIHFDENVTKVISTINETNASILIATHNRDSVENAISSMEKYFVKPNDNRINFAQIMGMCDILTNSLGIMGYNSHKLILFGEFMEIFPWLLRRLDENKDMLGAAQMELNIIRKELFFRIIDPFIVFRSNK
jgi:hypothetical protein